MMRSGTARCPSGQGATVAPPSPAGRLLSGAAVASGDARLVSMGRAPTVTPWVCGCTRSAWSSAQQGKDLRMSRLVLELAAQITRDHADAWRAHATAGHAAMAGPHRYCDAAWLQHAVNAVGDLGGQPLLYLQAPPERFDHPRELGDADHALVRQVGNVDGPGDGRHVMLAGRLQRNVAQQDDVVVAVDFLERAAEQGIGVLLVARKPLLVGARDARRRVPQTLTRGLVARPADQGAHCRLGFGARGPRVHQRRWMAHRGAGGRCK